MNLSTLAHKAEHSALYRWVLSYQLNHVVPFNAPHRFRIKAISTEHLRIQLPYRKRNLNHVKGLHACALATLAEATSGFLLVINLNPRKYRIILQKLEMEYHYQAKSHAYAEFTLSREWFEQKIENPLQEHEKIMLPCQVKIFDSEKNHVATGIPHWQIKDWQKVKTKLN